MNTLVDGKILQLDSQPGIEGGQYSASLSDNSIYLIPSRTTLVNGALTTIPDYTRKPLCISARGAL